MDEQRLAHLAQHLRLLVETDLDEQPRAVGNAVADELRVESGDDLVDVGLRELARAEAFRRDLAAEFALRVHVLHVLDGLAQELRELGTLAGAPVGDDRPLHLVDVHPARPALLLRPPELVELDRLRVLSASGEASREIAELLRVLRDEHELARALEVVLRNRNRKLEFLRLLLDLIRIPLVVLRHFRRAQFGDGRRGRLVVLERQIGRHERPRNQDLLVPWRDGLVRLRRAQQGKRAVAARVVHEDQLDVLKRLRPQGGDARGQVGLAVVDRNDHGDLHSPMPSAPLRPRSARHSGACTSR